MANSGAAPLPASPTVALSSVDLSTLLGYGLLAALLAELLVILFEPLKRWRLRHLPGPPAYPLVGCVLEVLRLGLPEFFLKSYKTYGPIYKVALGRAWVVVVADGELARQVGAKLQNRINVEPDLLRGELRRLFQFSLLQSKNEYWRMARSTWQPAFSRGSLSGYLPRMVDCAGKLVGRLEARAAAAAAVDGGQQQAAIADVDRVDIRRELGRMTMQVLGSTAFGTDFFAMEEPVSGDAKQAPVAPVANSDSRSRGKELTRACDDVFRLTNTRFGSRYQKIGVLLPELRPLLSWMAHAAPDVPFRRLLAGRTLLRDACRDLIAGWEDKQRRLQQQQQQQQASEGAEYALANGSAPEPKASADATTSGPEAVEPGSFLGLLLAARDKTTGRAFDKDEVVAQAQSFILAGYDTTATGLTFAVYFIASHPEVERRLLAEIDEVLGPDRLPTEADLPRLPYTEAVFYEALRLLPPAHLTTRELATAPIEVGGFNIPVGTPIILSIYSIQRDPRAWPRPEEFIPERFMQASPLYPEVCARVPGAHAPFGYGSRMCVGWKFAVQEAKIALARLYQRLRFELEPGQVPLATTPGLTLSPKDGLWVRPVPRCHHPREADTQQR